MFYLLAPYRSQGCLKGQIMCMHGVICFILINLIMQHAYFQKIKQINLLTPLQGSSVSVRAKYLLKCYCKLIPFYLIRYATWPYSGNIDFILAYIVCDPCSGPIHGPNRGVIWKKTWKMSTRWCYIPNIKARGLLVSDKPLFHVFPIY